MSELEAHARATSSITMHVARASAPTPPYSSGMCGAWKSPLTSASYAACGNSAFSSTSAAYGAILSVARSRTASRSGLVVLESVKCGKASRAELMRSG